MDKETILKSLVNEDNNKAYNKLLEYEKMSEDSNELYLFFNEFLNMIKSNKSFIKVRGFRMICSLAKWDSDNKIDKNIDEILIVFDDDKATNIRQCLSSLNKVLPHKKSLCENIYNKLISINLLKYKESMRDLIKKDIEKIINNMK